MRPLLAGLCMLAVVAGGCSKGTEAAKQSETSAAPSSPGGSAAPRASRGKASSAPNAAAPSAVLATPAPAKGAVPANASPPKTGTYTYTVTVNGKRSTRRTTISSDGASSSGAKLAEHSASGSASSTQHVAWTKASKYLTETVSTQGSDRFDCDWKPDMIEYEFPLHSGLHWVQTTMCTITYHSVKITSTVHNDATVRGNGEVKIGGRTVNVWVIDTTITNTSSYANKKSSAQIKRTTQFAADLGLAVRYVESGKSDSGGSVTATFELQNTTPS